MTCMNCGSAAVRPDGWCGTCGRPATNPPSAWPPPETTAATPPGSWPPPSLPAAGPAEPQAQPPAWATDATMAAPQAWSAQPHDSQPSQPYGTQPPHPYGTQPAQLYGTQPAQPHGTQPAQPYGTQPPPYLVGNQYPYAPAEPATGNGFSIAAFVLAAIAVLFLPIVFGLLAVVFGAIAWRRGEPHGKLALILGVVGTVAGFALGAVIGALL